MRSYTVTHLALRVKGLRQAEAYYCTLFGLDIAWREAETSDGWRTLPEGKTWHDAEAAGISLGLTMLYRKGFALALEASDSVTEPDRLSHVGLLVDVEELDRLRQHAAKFQCRLVHESPQTIVFDDAYRVRWEPTVIPYLDPKQLSSGVRKGTWLDI